MPPAPARVRFGCGVRVRGPIVRLLGQFVAEVPPGIVSKKIPTSEPKKSVAAFLHVKCEFRYESGMVELGLGGFLRLSHAFLADFNFQ